MEKVTAIIIDDENIARNNLRVLLNQYCPEVLILGQAQSARSARNLLREKTPDVVFLDINMPKEDGLSFLKKCTDRDFSVVMTTAHTEHALDAFREGAIGYLEKPIDIDELIAVVAKVNKIKLGSVQKVSSYMESFMERSKYFEEVEKTTIPTTDGFRLVPSKDIVLFRACDSYTIIHTVDGNEIVASKNIKFFEDTTNKAMFFRTHRSCIINLRYHLLSFNRETNVITVTNNHEVPLSRRKAPEFNLRTKADEILVNA